VVDCEGEIIIQKKSVEKLSYDVVVVGAGPGGSMAAKTCAKYGLDTVFVERKEDFKRGKFAQVLHRRVFDYIKIDDRFVDAKIRGIKIISPDGTELEMHEPKNFELFFGLNRERFDEELARLAVFTGAELMRTSVAGLIKEDGRVKGVKTKTNEKEIEIRSNIVIEAGGIESKYQDFKEVDSCIEYLVEGIDLDREYIHYRIREDPFESFYLVPKGEDKFAIAFFSPNPNSATEDRMDLFIKENFPEAKVIGKNHASIPLGVKQLFTDGLMLVGDCAGCASPLSRFGALFAMDSGVLAGETAVEAHEEGDFSSDLLARYGERWRKLHGARSDIEYEVRKFLIERDLSEEDVNSLFHILKDENGVFTDAFFKKIVKGKGKRSKRIKRSKSDSDLEKALFKEFRRYDDNIWDLFVR
jgi:digeranylgeranylglycerophospholipid reductase